MFIRYCAFRPALKQARSSAYLKDGGEYEEYTGKVRHIDKVERTVVFLATNGRSAGKAIKIDEIKNVHGELVDYMDEV